VTLDHLSKVVGWRGMAQRDPLNEYKQEAYELFQKLLADLRELVTAQLSNVNIQFRQPEPPPELALSEIHLNPATGENEVPDTLAGVLGAGPRGSAFAEASAAALGGMAGGASAAFAGPGAAARPELAPIDPKLLVGVSRNAPCPCGSGKKFKHCHGSF
jgi:preprotein translocase subunit SecA